MKKIIGLNIVFLLVALPLQAQVQDTTATDSVQTGLAPGDSLSEAMPDSVLQGEDEERKPINITPWKEYHSYGAQEVTNDSLMRWQVWSNWGNYQAYRWDVISFRQGTSGRIDAFHINGYQPYEQELEMEGLSLNDPVTGLPNYNLVPHRKIGRVTEFFAGNYQSEIQLRDYYLTKPISYLNYDEAGGSYRNLEFLVSRNFTERTNVEISYWDRRDGNYYPNSQVRGSQIVGRVYHHLNDRWLIRGMYMRNQVTRDEPFGYNVGNPAAFPFDEFTSQPLSSSANTEFNRWDLVGGIYHRKDTTSVENAGFETSITKNMRDIEFTGDTLISDIRTIYGKLFKHLEWNKLSLRGEIDGQLHNAQERTPVSRNNWSILDTEVSAEYRLFRDLKLLGKGNWKTRSDGEKGFDLGGGLAADLSDRLKFSANGSVFSHIPSMQALYWTSENYLGNENLQNEDGISLNGRLDFRLSPALSFGTSGRFKLSENTTFITPDSSFTNSGQMEQLSGSVYVKFDNNLLEVESSGVIQQFEYGEGNTPLAGLNNQDQIIWLRNSAFLKGYVFGRAAYLKIGVKTLFSPFYYASRTYNPELGIWQGNSTYQEIPAFFRMDGELSARVRAIMVVIRWENALDGFGQAGYFEAAGYPMPPRRLIVGIRAQFRN